MAHRQPSYPSRTKRKIETTSASSSKETIQPEDKRQKCEEDWDDEFSLSQADMHHIDRMSSRALSTVPVNTGTSNPKNTPENIFLAPKSTPSLRRSNSSSANTSSANTSTSSSTSLNGTDSIYPSSNDSVKRSSSSSLSSSSSVSSYGHFTSSGISDTLRDELDKWKTNCQKITEQKKSIENDIYIKDGEIKNLRNRMRQKDEELNSIRTENMLKVDEQKQHQSDRERNLKSNNEKLEARLQFRENEYSELEEKFRLLEHKLVLLHTSSSPKKLPSTPTKSPSSKVSKTAQVCISPRPIKGQFPTSGTFRSDERPEKSSSKPSTSSERTLAETVVESAVISRSRRCLLNTNLSAGEVNGPMLVAKLLEHNANSSGELMDRGVIGLLHTPSVSSNLQSMRFDRDQGNLLLSPVKSRKLSGGKNEPCSEVKPIVDKEHYNLAVHGLQTLLQSVQSSETCDTDKDLTLEPSISILPLLTDYLSHYISMLNLNQENTVINSPTNSGSLKSSSCDSSIESLTSSLGLLLRDGAMYAQNVETLTSASLITLKHLVTFSSAVRDTLYPKFNLIEADGKVPFRVQKPRSEAESSDVETDTTASLFTSVSSLVHQQLHTSNLLNIIIQLATPSFESPVFSSCIVKLALDVLNCLARKTSPLSHLESLALLTGILTNCLHCDTYSVILISAIELMTTLICCEKNRILLANQSAYCPLSALYMLTVKNIDNGTREEKINLDTQIINFMYNFCCYRNGVNLLLETSCSCGSEATRSAVLVVHRILEDYIISYDTILLNVLKQGLQLLYMMWLYDNDLSTRYFDIQYQFTNLMSSLSVIFKETPEQYENELNMLSDIWHNGVDDEDDDDNEDDDSMETE